MEIQSLKCPECMAPISTDIEGKEYIYCAHCGAKLIFNRGNKREYTININENVVQTINQNIISSTENDTKIERAKTTAKIFNSIKTIILAAIIGFVALALLAVLNSVL